MRTQQLLLAAAAVAGGLTVLAVVGAALQWWWLVVLAGMLLLSGILLAAVDTDRRVRQLRAFVKEEVRAVGRQRVEPDPGPSRLEEHVVGTVRALQAQCTGRLDRLQDSIESVLRQRDERS